MRLLRVRLKSKRLRPFFLPGILIMRVFIEQYVAIVLENIKEPSARNFRRFVCGAMHPLLNAFPGPQANIIYQSEQL